jgi:hypothetical protein
VTLYSGQRVFGDQIDFSPDGNSIAFVVNDGVPGRYSLLVTDLVTGEVRTLVTGVSGAPWEITWSDDGQSVLYTLMIGELVSPTGKSMVEYHRMPAAGGTSERVALDVGGIESMDRMRPNAAGSSGFILGLNKPEYAGYRVATWDGVTVRPDGSPVINPLAQGFHAHYSCDNSRFIYTATGVRTEGPIALFNIATMSSAVFSTDTNIKWTDWLPC